MCWFLGMYLNLTTEIVFNYLIIFLAKTCPQGMIFNHQMQPCQKRCEDMANCTDTGPPIAGCQCRNPFFVLELGKCIHPHQCGCIYNGTYLSVCVFHIYNIMYI